ncbi:GntR family transcriptional regulator [Arthrobacter sp. TMP15]|uniref:GntR family transcriptional regulator n=1 Tax=Arthrobacter sp. TMP15 TaxID=3140789 RepID=UPI0031BB2182
MGHSRVVRLSNPSARADRGPAMMIKLSGSAPPRDQIHDHIHGLVASGLLAADERQPSVRQLAKDLGVAPGTVAKAYRSLESEGFLLTRTGSGTRISLTAVTITKPAPETTRYLAKSPRDETPAALKSPYELK